MKIKFRVDRDIDLIKYLISKDFSKNKVKSLVKYDLVFVNDVLVEKLPYNLECGDIIIIDDKDRECNFKIIYEDNNYLVVSKPNGLLTISTSKATKNKEDTLYKSVRNYLNKKYEYAFIVNRIDKETSGIVIFVKNLFLKNKLQENWNEIVTSRKYMAVVCGKITSNGRIDNYLYEDKRTFSHSTKFGGKRAITNYKVVKFNKNYTLLDVEIETGRKNQIRVHFSEMNHPIVGDKKYYSKDNSLKRLMLHHYSISLVDPISNKELYFVSDVPDIFYRLFNNN